ncbi:tumor protein D53 [Lissotriton helveticus]
METQAQPDLLETQPLQEADEEMATDADFPILSEEEKEELSAEVVQLEDEITTLRQVLADKEKHLMEIKHKLGVNVMNELKQNFNKSWYDVQTHSAYKKTQETLSQAGQKATAAITNVGSAIGKKLGDMRNTPTFKSFEERLDSTVSNLKTKVGGTSNVGASFEEVLNSTAHASAQSCSVAETQLPEDEEDIQC